MHRSETKKVAIIGINRETTSILSLLSTIKGISVIKVLNLEFEELDMLKKYPFLDIIINATDDITVTKRLQNFGFNNTEIISGLSARIRFISGRHEPGLANLNGGKEKILGSLHDIKQAILLSRNKEEVLKLFLEVAIGTCGADSGSIMLVQPQHKFLTIEIADGLTIDIIKSTKQPFGEGIAGKVAKTGKSILINGPCSGNGEQREGDKRNVISAISSPLIIGTEVVGVLNISSKREGKTFTKTDLGFINELSGFAADVVKTSKDLETSSRTSATNSQLEKLQQIMSKSLPFEERLNLLLREIVLAARGVSCHYYEFEELGKKFIMKASSNQNTKLLQGQRMKLNDSITKKVLQAHSNICLHYPIKNSLQQKWYIAYPLRIHRRIISLLLYQLLAENNDITVEQQLVEQAGTILITELKKETEQHHLKMKSVKLSAVAEATFAIASAKDLMSLVNFALPNACLILEAEVGFFWLTNAHSGKIELIKSYSSETPHIVKEILGLDKKILSTSGGSKDFIIIDDIRQIYPTAPPDIPSSALIKIFGRKNSIQGILSLYGKTASDRYGVRNFAEFNRDIFLKVCLQFAKGLAKFIPDFDVQ